MPAAARASAQLLDGSGRLTLLDRRKAAFGPHSLLFFEEPLEVVRAAGTWIEDASGRRYLDAYNNVPHVGHCHPRVVAAAAEQFARLNIHSRYLHAGVTAYAERLLALFPPVLDRALFACTGTEANELALRIARRHCGAHGVIVSRVNYHGNSTLLASLATAIPSGEPFPPWARTIDVVAANDADELADMADAAIRSLASAGFGVAALLIDPIFSFEGLPERPRGFLAPAVARVRAAGGIYIADEVQAGFGRMGDAMWGWCRHDAVPDLVTMGKPMANGYPAAAVIAPSALADPFLQEAIYFNTYAAGPVAAAMGSAVLDIIEDEALVANAFATGAVLQRRLQDIHSRFSRVVSAVRGRGLYAGLEIARPEIAAWLVEAMRREGVLVGRTGSRGEVVKIRPPICFTERDVDTLADAFQTALEKVAVTA